MLSLSSLSNPLGILGIHHLEFACADRETSSIGPHFSRFGLLRTKKNATSELYSGGDVRFLLTAATPGHHSAHYLKAHGEGVCRISFRTDDVEKAYRTALERGGEGPIPPQTAGSICHRSNSRGRGYRQ